MPHPFAPLRWPIQAFDFAHGLRFVCGSRIVPSPLIHRISPYQPQMSTHYERVEDIPPKTCFAIEDDGSLILKSAGVPSAWITADLGARNVTANVRNYR